MRRSRRCRWLVENGYVPRERHCLPHGRPYRQRSRWGGSAAPLPWGVRLRSPLRCPVSESARKRWSCSGGMAWSGWKSCAENGFEKSKTGKSEHRQTAGPANAEPAVFTMHRFRNSDSCAWTYRGIPHIGPEGAGWQASRSFYNIKRQTRSGRTFFSHTSEPSCSPCGVKGFLTKCSVGTAYKNQKNR